MLQGFGRYRVSHDRIVLPDACCDVTFVNGRQLVTGPMTVARPWPHGAHDVVLLRIGVLAARDVLGVPLSELTDLVVPLEEVNGSLARRLAQRFEIGQLATAFDETSRCTGDRRFATAARWLSRGSSVRSAAAMVALSERHLARLFEDRVGVPPKLFTRIVRLRRAVIAARLGVPLAQAAAESGYADQSHFTREVSMLTGHPPRSLLPIVGDVRSVQDAACWREVGCE